MENSELDSVVLFLFWVTNSQTSGGFLFEIRTSISSSNQYNLPFGINQVSLFNMRHWDNAFKSISSSNLLKVVLESLQMHRRCIRAMPVGHSHVTREWYVLKENCIRFLGFVLLTCITYLHMLIFFFPRRGLFYSFFFKQRYFTDYQRPMTQRIYVKGHV